MKTVEVGSTVKIVEALAGPVSTAERFFEEMLAFQAGAFETTATIQAAYTEWCRRVGAAPEKREALFRELIRWSGDRLRPERRGPRGNQRRGYTGVMLRRPQDSRA